MSTLTYDVAAPTAATRKPATSRKGVLARFYDRLIEARMQKAVEELGHYRHLLPRELEQAGWKIGERSEDSLPFVR